MTIRGLIAHNGIYNWTMFLPDHPIHTPKPPPSFKIRKGGLLPLPTINDEPTEEEGIFTDLKDHAPTLFRDPSNLFDPFASACLFFHTPDLHVPDDFTTPLNNTDVLGPAFSAAVNKLANHQTPSSSSASPTYSPDTEWEPEPEPPSPSSSPPTPPSPKNPEKEQPQPPEEEEEQESAYTILARASRLAKQAKPARKAYLAFPPLSHSTTLRLPPTLLIHSVPSTPPDPDDGDDDSHGRPGKRSGNRSRSRSRSRSRNSFAVQARELAGVMLRSLDMYEFRRGKRAGRVAPWEREDGGEGVLEGEEVVVEELDGEEVRAREAERWEAIQRRVQSFEAVGTAVSDGVGGGSGGGGGEGSLRLDGEGEAVVGEWLRERIDEDLGGEGEIGGKGV